MEECKELFQNISQTGVKEAVEKLKQKLQTKQNRIRELSNEITEEEGRKMLRIIEKKMISYDKCRRMFSKSNLSDRRESDQ